MKLREYQQAHNDAVRSAVRAGRKRIISCMATGSGKSIKIAELTKNAVEKMKTVIIILPRRSLVDQLSKSFADWGINHGVIMSKRERFSMPMVQIVSIDTYMSRIASGKMDILKADLLILDEMHLQFTSKKLEVFRNYPFVVAFSATPIAPRKQALGDFYDCIVETISMKELMLQGFLVKLRYFADPTIDLSGIRLNSQGDYLDSDLSDVMDKPDLVGDIYKNWLRIASGKPTVIFTSSQSHALHLTQEFCSHGWTFEYVDCETSDEDRKLIFDRVRTGEAIGICNVGIVSVGIDIPNLEVCVLARPTKSIANYHQCVGRVTRPYPGKTEGLVIDHAGIIEKLGFAEDPTHWTLEGKTVEELTLKDKQERKEPKEIICKQCNYVFKARRDCPKCGFSMVKKGEPIPCYEAELKEVKEKYTGEQKEKWYREMLGYCRRYNKKDGYAFYQYISKFGVEPKWKKIAEQPSQEIFDWVKHISIKREYRHGKV